MDKAERGNLEHGPCDTNEDPLIAYPWMSRPNFEDFDILKRAIAKSSCQKSSDHG